MAADWRMQGVEFDACNCAWGCPCQFNALPTTGRCEGTLTMRVEKGHFDGEPIKNPVTGELHFPRLVLPTGFEFKEAEMASSTIRATGTIAFSTKQTHGHFAVIHHGPQGYIG